MPASRPRLHIVVSSGPIGIAEVLAAIGQSVHASDGPSEDPEAGALAVFSGTVRATEGDRTIGHLDYEYYPGMAEKQMTALAEEAAGRWPLHAIALVHRIGAVPTAEPSVIVAVTAGHRAEAFEAARFLIDELKVRVPIWKAAPA